MTDKLRQAAQQMLEAVADLTILTPREWQAVHGLKIDALRAALAEPDRMTPKELAERLKRGEKWQLAEQPAESLDGKLVMGLAVIRELTGTQKTDNIEATIEAVRKAVAPQPAIPPGYKLVPVEPTIDMLRSGVQRELADASHYGRLRDTYRAMLAAAPEVPQPAKPAEQCWKCGDMDPSGHEKCNVPACGMREDTQPAKREPLTDEQISLMAHNDDEGDWNHLTYRDCWHEGYKAGARAIERTHGIGGQP